MNFLSTILILYIINNSVRGCQSATTESSSIEGILHKSSSIEGVQSSSTILIQKSFKTKQTCCFCIIYDSLKIVMKGGREDAIYTRIEQNSSNLKQVMIAIDKSKDTKKSCHKSIASINRDHGHKPVCCLY